MFFGLPRSRRLTSHYRCQGGRCQSDLRQSGLSLIELVVASAVLVILSAAVFPLARTNIRQHKELELRFALTRMRHAIDEYKRFCELGLLGEQDLESVCYPEELESLTEPIQLVGQPPDTKFRFLHRIPVDPMTGDAEWGLRSYEDDWDSDSWGGENVYDVYSQSTAIGLNGIAYDEW